MTETHRAATLFAVTTEGTLTSATEADPPALYCYRHPDRETWVRCGRCDQPICSRCAMQGPVGFRCRECGRSTVIDDFRFRCLACGSVSVEVTGGDALRLLDVTLRTEETGKGPHDLPGQSQEAERG